MSAQDKFNEIVMTMDPVKAEALWGFGDDGFPQSFDSIGMSASAWREDGDSGCLIEEYSLLAFDSESGEKATIVASNDLDRIEPLLTAFLRAHLHGDERRMKQNSEGTSDFWSFHALDDTASPADMSVVTLRQDRRDGRKAVIVDLGVEVGSHGKLSSIGRLDVTLMDQSGKNFINSVRKFLTEVREAKNTLTREMEAETELARAPGM